MANPAAPPRLEGGCACGQVRYRLHDAPLLVHCCHCTRCQRETGAAFAINALVLAEHVEHLGDRRLTTFPAPTDGGPAQDVARCAACGVALWSNYAGWDALVRFVRVGTLDQPAAVRPDVHIYTRSRAPWLQLPPDVPAFEAFYDVAEVWGRDARRKAVWLQRAARVAQAGDAE
jgi:hypothetical protein